MNHHTKTLVVDFDDTLALTLNRDWANALPNTELISRLNSLYDEGWTIHVLTARGQLSCEGDWELADVKYRPQIETWLEKHGVKYTDLSFQKQLAAYYIDDKGITPEDFIANFGREEFKSGMSGAHVYYDKMSNAVYKTASNTQSVVEWYKKASEYGFHTPLIHSVIGDTIKMDRLKNDDQMFYFDRALTILEDFAEIAPLHVGLLPKMYTQRCLHRISQDDKAKAYLDLVLLDNILDYASWNTKVSFSHGDYSYSNLLFDKDRVYLIDPINDPTLLSSWMIDLAKLYMSIEFDFGKDDQRLNKIIFFARANDMTEHLLWAHVVGHHCRVYPYADAEKKAKILTKLIEYQDVFRQEINRSKA